MVTASRLIGIRIFCDAFQILLNTTCSGYDNTIPSAPWSAVWLRWRQPIWSYQTVKVKNVITHKPDQNTICKDQKWCRPRIGFALSEGLFKVMIEPLVIVCKQAYAAKLGRILSLIWCFHYLYGSLVLCRSHAHNLLENSIKSSLAIKACISKYLDHGSIWLVFIF